MGHRRLLLPAANPGCRAWAVRRDKANSQDRKNATVLIACPLEPELHEDLTDVRLDGLRTEEEGGADALVESALGNH